MPDTFRACDLTPEHFGRYLRGEGVDGVLQAIYPVDDLFVQLLLDRPPHLVTVPAGRPLDLPLDCPPV